MKKALPLLAAAGLMAAAAPASGSSFVYKPFHTPSHKIRCAYFKDSSGKFMRCDTTYRIKPIGHRHCMEGDYGASVSMGATGRPHPSVGVASSGAALPSGLSCRSTRMASTGSSMTSPEGGVFSPKSHRPSPSSR